MNEMTEFVWRHQNDDTECVAGRIWCDRHRGWECADSHDRVYPTVPAPSTPARPVSSADGDPGRHSEGQQR